MKLKELQLLRFKKKVLLKVVILLLLPLAINYAITGASPFSLTENEFLVFYAFFAMATLISHYLLREDSYGRTKEMLEAWTLNGVNIFQLTHSVYGKERAFQTCVVDLYRRNLVTVNEDTRKIVVHNHNYRAPQKEANPLVPLLLAAPDGNSYYYTTLVNDWYNPQLFEHSSIKQLDVLTNINESRYKRNIAVIIALIIGLARIMQEWMNNRPVVFVFFEMVAVVFFSGIISSTLSAFEMIKLKLKQLLHEKAGNNYLYADGVVNDYALNGQRVLTWLPDTMMLGSMFLLFPTPVPGSLDDSCDSSRIDSY